MSGLGLLSKVNVKDDWIKRSMHARWEKAVDP